MDQPLFSRNTLVKLKGENDRLVVERIYKGIKGYSYDVKQHRSIFDPERKNKFSTFRVNEDNLEHY